MTRPRSLATLTALALLFVGCDDAPTHAGTGGSTSTSGAGSTSTSASSSTSGGSSTTAATTSGTASASSGTGGAGGSDPACAALGAKLQAAVDQHFANTPVQPDGGASVAVIQGNCRWVGAVGEAHAGVPMTPAHLFRVASVTKTFVAATVLRLAEEGKLTLDDKIDKWVSGVPSGGAITVRMLLDHTSGLYDYVNDPAFQQQALAQPNTPMTPQSLVDVATSHAPTSPPGQGYHYTNTGFILAGMIIEAVTQSTASAAIRQRTFTPANLSETFFAGEEVLPSSLATGFDPQGNDATNAFHPSVNWTAGAVVATAGDLADWAKALYGGQILSPASLTEMLTPIPTGAPGMSYGLGASLYDASKLGNFSPGVGHNGHLPGYFADMVYLTNDGTVIVQLGNAEAGKNFLGILLVTLYSP